MKQLFLHVLLLLSTVSFSQSTYLPFSKTLTKTGKVSALPQRTVNDQAEQYCEVDFDFPGAYISTKTYEEHGIFQYMYVEGFASNNEPGKPALPTRNASVVLPGGESNVSIEIIEQQFEEYDNYRIHPALKPASDTYGADEPEFEIDYELYATDAFFPSDIVEINKHRQLRGIPIASVRITPVQFNPVTNKIRVYSKIKYKLVFGNQRSSSDLLNKNSEKYNNYIRSIVINPMALPETSGSRSIYSEDRKDYIILTHAEFEASANKLATWKKQLGYTVEVLSREDWTSELVDFVLKERYNSWVPRPDYFVIIGDHDGEYPVPGKIMVDGSTSFASDNRYSCMDGMYDFEPDMARGRIPARSKEDAVFMIDKIINYEKNPPSKESYYKTTLNCAYFQDDENDGIATRRFCQTSEEIRNHMLSQGYTVDRVYSTASDNPTYWNNGRYSGGELIPSELHKPAFPWVPEKGGKEDIIREWNEGKFLIFHRDHGYSGGRGWADPQLMLEDIPDINNTSEYPVVFSINCHTGQFIETECFSELLMKNRSGGAVGVFAAAQASYSGSNDALVLGFYDAIWPGVMVNFSGSGGNYTPPPLHQSMYNMGYILNYGLARMLETWPAGQDEYQCDLYHYFGDPTMQMRTQLPVAITASLDESISCNDTELIITGCNVADAFVTICLNGQLIAKSQLTGGSGVLVFEALGASSEDAVITLSAPNTIPLIKRLAITGDCSLVPIADFKCSQYIVATGETIALTDLSKRNSNSWQWSFWPKEVAFVEGTNSTSPNPIVQFNKSGTYTVELKVTNEHGENVKTKTDFIVAKAGAPSNINSVVKSSREIALTWKQNAEANNVMVAFSSDGVFGMPEDGEDYHVGQTIAGGGTVAYVGSETSLIHGDLPEFTYTYYKLWSYTSDNEYSYIGSTHADQTAKSLVEPYIEQFTEGVKPNLLNGWKALGNSSQPWETMAFTSTSLCVGHVNNQGFTADDWLFSPGLEMEADKTYKVSFKVRGVNDNLIVNYGRSADPLSATEGILFNQRRFYGNIIVEKEISPSQSGVYYLAFYHYGEARELKIDDVTVVCMSDNDSFYWLGGTPGAETDWLTASNWTNNAIPDINHNVYIGANKSHYPIVDDLAACKELFILDGGKLTIEENGHLSVQTNLWNGGGTSGSFHLFGGLVDIGENYCGEDNSFTDIDDGTLNITESWLKNLKDGYHFCRGKAQLSGGAINIGKSVAFGGNSRWEGIMDGPVVVTVGHKYRNTFDNWTITDGTVILTGDYEGDNPTIYSSQNGSVFYNLIIDGNDTFNHGSSGSFHVLNDLTIKEGYVNTNSCTDFIVEGNMTIKSGVTFDVQAEWNTVKGDLNIECDALVNDLNRLRVHGTINEDFCNDPVAEFSSNRSTVTVGQSVQFTDMSINEPFAWQWTFEGGSPESSNAKNPVVTYSNAGQYEVMLQVTNGKGTDTNTKAAYVNVVTANQKVVANFNSDVLSINQGESITFSDLSSNSPNSWSWEFAGGSPSVSTDQNPTIAYEQAGVYTVALEVDNGNGSNKAEQENYIVVNSITESLRPDFTSNIVQGNVGDVIEFTDITPNEPLTWYWEFEGGQPASSVEQNPIVRYPENGNFKVYLRVYNAAGYKEVVRENYIQIVAGLNSPEVNFECDSRFISGDEQVTFSDVSSNNPTSWKWIFEGGTPATSTVQNPVVTYMAPGRYNVTLEATNDFGTGVKKVEKYVTVEELPAYCEASNADNTDMERYIRLVQLGSINNESLAEEGGYADYTDQSTELVIGESYPMTVEQTHRLELMTCGVWIDWNKDGDFEDEGEQVYELLPEVQFSPYNFNVVVPQNVEVGQTRMRVRTHYNKVPFACGFDSKATGEVEDYTINIVESAGPDANFGTVLNTLFVSEQVQFYNASKNEPTQCNWTFEGGTPATSNLHDPIVTYHEAGVYAVRLEVVNENGISERTEMNYITVVEPVVDVESIVLTGERAIKGIGSQSQLSVSFSPVNATLGEIMWSSSDDRIASISQDGLVTAVSVGVATITASLKDNSSVFNSLEVKISDLSTGSVIQASGAVTAYPNPFTSSFTIRMGDLIDKPVTIKVYDAQGRMLIEQKYEQCPSEVLMGEQLTEHGYYVIQIVSIEGAPVILKICK